MSPKIKSITLLIYMHKLHIVADNYIGAIKWYKD